MAPRKVEGMGTFSLFIFFFLLCLMNSVSKKRESFLLSLSVAQSDFTGRLGYGSPDHSPEVDLGNVVWCVCVRGVLAGTVRVTAGGDAMRLSGERHSGKFASFELVHSLLGHEKNQMER